MVGNAKKAPTSPPASRQTKNQIRNLGGTITEAAVAARRRKRRRGRGHHVQRPCASRRHRQRRPCASRRHHQRRTRARSETIQNRSCLRRATALCKPKPKRAWPCAARPSELLLAFASTDGSARADDTASEIQNRSHSPSKYCDSEISGEIERGNEPLASSPVGSLLMWVSIKFPPSFSRHNDSSNIEFRASWRAEARLERTLTLLLSRSWTWPPSLPPSSVSVPDKIGEKWDGPNNNE